MGQKVIYCKNCEEKKADIETGGANKVISCEPLPDQDDVSENDRKCLIKWVLNDL